MTLLRNTSKKKTLTRALTPFSTLFRGFPKCRCFHDLGTFIAIFRYCAILVVTQKTLVFLSMFIITSTQTDEHPVDIRLTYVMQYLTYLMSLL